MEKEENRKIVVWNGEKYIHYVNEKGQEVLVQRDKKGFVTEIVFTGEQELDIIENKIIKKLL